MVQEWSQKGGAKSICQCGRRQRGRPNRSIRWILRQDTLKVPCQSIRYYLGPADTTKEVERIIGIIQLDEYTISKLERCLQQQQTPTFPLDSSELHAIFARIQDYHKQTQKLGTFITIEFDQLLLSLSLTLRKNGFTTSDNSRIHTTQNLGSL